MRSSFALLAIALVAGCSTGPDSYGRFPGLGGEVGTDGGIEISDASGDGTDTDPSSATDAWGESSTGEPLDPDGPHVAAIDITPTGLHANQGVALTLAEEGDVIDPALREAAMLHGRATLFFGTWTTVSSFEPRMIRGELHVAQIDGTEETLVSEVRVDGPSGAGQNDAHFTWMLDASQVQAATRWWVTLHEVELDPDGREATDAPRLPSMGDAALVDEDGDQRIRIVFVPIRHVYGACNQLAPSDAGVIEGHRRLMEMTYPTQQVEITVHPEFLYTGDATDLGGALTNLVSLRAFEVPEPDVYYYASIDPCQEPMQGGLGYVPEIPTSIEDAQWRAAIGVYYDWDPTFSEWTMVHEVGHNHGRQHVACAGTEAGTDPEYPIAGGATGVLGWGIHDGSFHAASATDYMTYCVEDLWTSSYAWSRTLEVIDALSGLTGAAPPPSHRDAVAIVVRDGSITAAAYVPGAAPIREEGSTRWRLADDRFASAAWQRDHVPDSDAEFFTVAAPAGLRDVVALELDTWQGTLQIPRDRIALRSGRAVDERTERVRPRVEVARE